MSLLPGIQMSFSSVWGMPMYPVGPSLQLTFFHMPLKTVALDINLWVFLLSNITLYFIASSSLNCELVEGIYCRQVQCKTKVKGLVSRLQ